MTRDEIDQVALRVVELLQETRPMGVLVDVEEVVKYTGMSRDWCYRHAACCLAGRKLGNKVKFSLAEIDERLRMAKPSGSGETSCSDSRQSAAGSPAPGRVRRRRRRSTAHTTASAAQTTEHEQA